MSRKICTLLLYTHFDIERFRDITLAQLIVILEKTALKDLNKGYFIVMDDRKKNIKAFAQMYLSKDSYMFCHLFMQCDFQVNCPWYSKDVQKSVGEYIKYVSSDLKEDLVNIHQTCRVNDHVNNLFSSNLKTIDGWATNVENGKWNGNETIKSACGNSNENIKQWYGERA